MNAFFFCRSSRLLFSCASVFFFSICVVACSFFFVQLVTTRAHRTETSANSEHFNTQNMQMDKYQSSTQTIKKTRNKGAQQTQISTTEEQRNTFFTYEIIYMKTIHIKKHTQAQTHIHMLYISYI